MFGRGTRARCRLLAATLTLCAAGAGATAVPAGAEIRSGSGADVANDTAVGAHDLVGTRVDYDSDAGVVTATFTFRDAPSSASDALAAVGLGVVTPTGCRPVLVMMAAVDPALSAGASSWTIVNGPTGSGTRAYDPAARTMTVRAADRDRLSGGALDCALAETTPDGTTTYDELTQFALAGPPPTPTPTPTPQPQPTPPAPTPTPPPTPAPAPGPQKVKPPPGVKLAIELPTVKPMRTNRWTTAKLRVANTGTKAAKDVRLTVKLPRGVNAKRKTVKLKTIAAGKKRTATLKLRLTNRARATSTLRATVSSKTKGAAKAKGDLVLTKWRKGAKGKLKSPKPGPQEQPATLAGQAFTRVEVDVMSSNRWFGYTFLDGQWAYRGIPEGTGFPQCTAKTAGVDERGDETDGCLPYTYDPKTNALTIDGQPFTVSPDRTSITQGDKTWTLNLIPAPGTTWNLALKGIAVSGYWPNQFVSQNWLAMNTAGEFTNSRETLGTWGGGAMNPGGGNFASASPDQRGTYAVLPGGLIEFRYADGDVVRQSILITRDAKTGDVDPARVGFLLDGVQYFLDTDE